jgi:PAS domain S-box-containing protein/putative nucleotidyltransferase with HDIG domain
MPDDSVLILLIEDEPAHAELIQRAFENRGKYTRLQHVQSLAEARSFLAANTPSLIISDWRLPDGDSLELLPAGDVLKDIPVIFMTSYGNERLAVEALKSGALDYVVKSSESMMDMPHIADRAIEQGMARTEQARMQRALAESEAQFRLLAENSSDVISRHDSKGRFAYVSPASRSILGHEQKDLLGRSAFDLVHPEDLPKVRAMLNVRPGRNSIYTVSYRARRKDGSYVWLETSARTILDENTGAVSEVHAASRDITERKRAEEALQIAHRELQDAYDRTIEGWIRALDLRDRETEGHTQRVTEMAIKVSRALGLPDSEIVHVRRGALLHDIGKIAIPDEITKKTGPLSEKEWSEMRKHPTYAYEMLKPIKYLKPALDIPYCHHERWDGSGYPRRLKQEEIPLTARMFAIIDVWDALISDRPYRKASSTDEVIAYIRKEAGHLFDPRLVELFLTVLKSSA